jgi:hypothetical protein
MERDLLLRLVAPTGGHQTSASDRLDGDFLRDPCFPDTGLAGEQEEATAATDHDIQRTERTPYLLRACDEAAGRHRPQKAPGLEKGRCERRTRGSGARRRRQSRFFLRLESQRSNQKPQRIPAWQAQPALEIADPARTHAGTLGKLFLRHARSIAVAPEQETKSRRFCRAHG